MEPRFSEAESFEERAEELRKLALALLEQERNSADGSTPVDPMSQSSASFGNFPNFTNFNNFGR